jgi:hypothetical protein
LGNDPGGVRVGSGAGGAGAVGVAVMDEGRPGGVQPGVGDPVGRGVALGCADALTAVAARPGS